MNKRLKSPAVWMPLALAVALVAGMWIGKSVLTSRAGWDSRTKLDTILDMISDNYVDEIDTDSILEATLPSLLSQLDPHSVYIPASDLQSVNEELEGSFSGIGISFNMMGDTINILEIISGGPSERAGLLPGDRIVTIDDSIVAGQKWPNSKVMKHLRGPKGTVVNLGVKRHTTDELLSFEVTRDDIPVTSIDAAYFIDDDTGLVKINKFGATTFSEFLTNMITLKAQGAKRFIIDLRGNTGGFMDHAVLMANEFLPAGSPIVSMKGEHTKRGGLTVADGSGSLKDAQVVVLIDEISASASEIFAGALQDNDRGLIVGRRSFGKGLVQNQFQLPDSSALRLTIARYYTPSGRCIQKTYAPGVDYERELLNRYEHGELYSADSIHQDKSLAYETVHGRTVYGGGGITPDLFVPNDSSGITSWYINVVNAGLIQKFTFDYTDRNRDQLSASSDGIDLVDNYLPDDDTLLSEFVAYTRNEGGITPRWYYINLSRDLLVNQLKALIARNIHGVQGYYEVWNLTDPTVDAALNALREGRAAFPINNNE
ncbi:MAG: S41 family peptidase [Bacteroides sp.]|nr:S41 family peptidase [Bacteroides sp.]